MTIWVDADACPAAVKELILKASARRELHCCFVANKPFYLPNSPLISFVQVAAGPDVADAWIAEHAQTGDIVITQDIPLAAMLVPKQIYVINPHGTVLNANNIGERLAVRNLMQDLRDTGTITGGPKPYGPKDKQQFANALDRILTQAFPA